ncbi:alpha/beta fold hydrolase [Alkalicoccus luteus]|uniref:Alpha/beta hydrolase n=1 Tax=Alkalicoccus luteus TaxID=1237094 RepID=A0A969TV99_9BACI|nr:alpha/beta hydrolase [Alkalicoccus luteus]NJP36159.1 alpha/beta hydrolase [Alkalicoccus luteus]
MNQQYGTFEKDAMVIEYTQRGEGPPVLFLHGGHASCFETIGTEALLSAGYSVIAPSRPGYGATSPISNLDAACSLYDGLLAHLGLERIHVLSASAGGPAGIRFAALYPKKTASLTLQSAVTKEWITPADPSYKAAKVLFHPKRERFTWRLLQLISRRFPKLLFRQMFSSFSTLSYQEAAASIAPGDAETFARMMASQRSGKGFMIDLEQSREARTDTLAAITCPVLIMHSPFDASVSFAHAEHAAAMIPNARLEKLHAWGHLIWLGRDAGTTDRLLLAFLREHQ